MSGNFKNFPTKHRTLAFCRKVLVEVSLESEMNSQEDAGFIRITKIPVQVQMSLGESMGFGTAFKFICLELVLKGRIDH